MSDDTISEQPENAVYDQLDDTLMYEDLNTTMMDGQLAT